MKKKTEYTIDGKSYVFDNEVFGTYFREYANKNNFKLLSFEEEIANTLSISSQSVHGWRLGYYSPSSLAIVEEISQIFGISCLDILQESYEMKDLVLDTNIKDALRRVYRAFVDFFKEYECSRGFLYLSDTDLRIDDEWSYAEREIKKVKYALIEEYVDLMGEIYTSLDSYIKEIETDLYIDLCTPRCEDWDDLMIEDCGDAMERMLTDVQNLIASYLE